jgi:hypothetical protein
MGREKGHPGPVKPEAEKMNKPVRIGFTSGELELVKKDAKKLKISVSKYFRTLWLADHTKNGK